MTTTITATIMMTRTTVSVTTQVISYSASSKIKNRNMEDIFDELYPYSVGLDIDPKKAGI